MLTVMEQLQDSQDSTYRREKQYVELTVTLDVIISFQAFTTCKECRANSELKGAFFSLSVRVDSLEFRATRIRLSSQGDRCAGILL